MSRIVLIDGENLTYGLRSILTTSQKLVSRDILKSFQYRAMIEEMLEDKLPNKIIWYGARLKQYDQSSIISEKSKEAIRNQSYFVNDLIRQKIDFVKVGYLRARETEPCKNCGNSSWKLAEKGVDVGIAVRILIEAFAKNEVVVISADTDLLPAFKAAQDIKAKIMNIGYENRPIFSLSKVSNSTRLITLPLVKKYITKP